MGEHMEKLRLQETQVFESSGVFDFPDGSVKVYEREVREVYRTAVPRLVIGDAVEKTKGFITKARAEFADLNTLMTELTAR